jgi:hypothetical protein
MASPRDRGPSAAESSLVALGLGLMLLVSPLRLVWAQVDVTWMMPFLVWIALIVAAALAGRPAGREDR